MPQRPPPPMASITSIPSIAANAGVVSGAVSNPGGTVAGLTVAVTQNGNAIGTATTDSNGLWSVSVSSCAKGDVFAATVLLPIKNSQTFIIPATDVTFTGKFGVRLYQDSVAAGVRWNAWLGKNADYYHTFMDKSSWINAISSINTLISNYAGDPTPKIWSIGQNVTNTTLAQAAAGNFNSYYTQMANLFLADAPSTGFIFIRVGHEFNLTGNYPWEVIASGASAAYVSSYRLLVSCFRAVSNRFRFIWCPNWISTGANPSFDVRTCYPGNDVVDVIGMDVYYSQSNDPSSDVAFNYNFNGVSYALQWQASFAASNNRAAAIVEFGIGSNHPRWIDLIWNHVHTNSYAFACYFDLSDGAGNWTIDANAYPDVTARVKANFVNGGPIPISSQYFDYGLDGWTTGRTPTDGWIAVGGSASVTQDAANYRLKLTGVSNYTDCTQFTWSGLTSGHVYTVKLDLNTGGLNARVQVVDATTPYTTLYDHTYNTSSMTTQTFTFTGDQTSAIIKITPYAGNAAQTVYVDNVLLFA